MKLGVYKIHEDSQLPTYGSESAACFDIRAYLNNKAKLKCFDMDNEELLCETFQSEEEFLININPFCRVLVPTGLIFDIPEGYSLRLHPRSGLAFKKGVSLANCEGVVDSDYYHETFVALINNTESRITIKHGERICQGEIVPVNKVDFEVVHNSPTQTTSRQGGFGSTGTS